MRGNGLPGGNLGAGLGSGDRGAGIGFGGAGLGVGFEGVGVLGVDLGGVLGGALSRSPCGSIDARGALLTYR